MPKKNTKKKKSKDKPRPGQVTPLTGNKAEENDNGQTGQELRSETKHTIEQRNVSGPGDMAGPACVHNHGAPNSVNLFPGAKLVNHGAMSLPRVNAEDTSILLRDSISNDIADLIKDTRKLSQLQVEKARWELSDKKREKTQTKEAFGFLILKNILEKNHGKAELQDLILVAEESVKIYDGALTFEQLCGAQVRDFIMMHTDVFKRLNCDNSTCVALRCKGDSSLSTRSFAEAVKQSPNNEQSNIKKPDSSNSLQINQLNSETDLSDNQWTRVSRGKKKPLLACDEPKQVKKKSTHYSSKPSSAKTNYSASTSTSLLNLVQTTKCEATATRRQVKNCTKSDEEWTEVIHSQRAGTKSSKPNKDKPLAREVLREDDQDPNIGHLKSLLEQEEGRDLMFVKSHDIYFAKPHTCQQDIISMWNTPHRIRSYIVIGVTKGNPKKLIGCNKDFDVNFYSKERLFTDSTFSFTPTYVCLPVQYKSMTFVVIEIASSWKMGQPSIVKKDVILDDFVLKQNELWYRDGCKNAFCVASNETFGMIFHWFLGTNDPSLESLGKGFIVPELVKSEQTVLKRPHMVSNHLENCDEWGSSESCSSMETHDVIEEEGEFTKFWKACGEFKKRHFILISGDISNRHKHLRNLSLIPWIAVYDFDINSCTNGLLNAVQDECEQIRHLKISTWKEPPPVFSENGTHWCFMRGYRELSDTRTDSQPEKIEDHHTWLQTVKISIAENCEQIVSFADEYTVYTIVILWPKTEEIILFIRKFLDKIVYELNHKPKLVVCMNEKCRSADEETALNALKMEYSSCIHVCIIDFSDLCLGLGSKLQSVGNRCLKYELPRMQIDILPDFITEKDAMWLKEDLEVLYLQNPYKVTDADHDFLETEIINFFKGGRFPWSAWYEIGDSGVDIRRDSLKDAIQKIDKLMSQSRCSTITILHAPGSGGSTLAQRILWDYHEKIPCVQVRRGTLLKTKDLSRKIEFIHEKTHLTTLILIDDEDDVKVKQFCKSLKFAIILNVKRYPFKFGNLSNNPKDKSALQRGHEYKIYLSGKVSNKEARELAVKFGERCSPERKKTLEKMKNDVMRSRQHSLYEFGMTVYSHEFKGIAAHVRGYLQISREAELSHINKCLGYLALVYFYGQASLPCQFFARLFYKQPNHQMILEEDFPHPVTEFVVYETNDRKQHMIRICHYEIAKEILEQILSKDCSRQSHAWEHHYSDKLSKNACKNLAAFSKDFIEYCSNKKTSNYKSSTAIGHILARTFIYRDEVDLTLTAVDFPRKKAQVSQLLLDIPAGKPMFEERLQILEKLASSFPDEPNFHAHVGRFYAFCGPDDDEKAEKKFKKAISLVKKRIEGSKLDQLDDSSKSTLVHVYHMYGSFKKKQISSMIGKHKNEETKTMEAEEKFYVKISKLVEEAELACELFEKSRVLTPDTCEIFTGSYIGEINVRLQISDYVIRHYKETVSEHEVLKRFLESEATAECRSFIEETICRLEYLFNACSEDADMENVEKHSIMTMIKWYNALFKLQVLPQECLTVVHEIDIRRINISALKLDYGSRPELQCIENVNDAGAVEKIITLYEDNFKDISMGQFEVVSKKRLDYDYQEWICAIRHDLCQRVYNLDDVCTHVQIWNQTVRSPMSLFYLFVVKSVMGIGHDSAQGNTESLIEAKELQQELTKKVSLLLKPKHHREWLGNGVGIKAILQSNRKIPISHHEVKDQRVLSVNLKVCKGTICPPNNKPYYGQIELDLQVDNLKVFFVPKRAELDGPRHKGRRVQFNLAFSFEHGYEALNVKVLKRHGCSNCSQKLEFKISDTSLVCPTCKVTVFKDDLNEVKSDSDEEKKN